MEEVVTESHYEIPGLGSLCSKSYNRMHEKVSNATALFPEFIPTTATCKRCSRPLLCKPSDKAPEKNAGPQLLIEAAKMLLGPSSSGVVRLEIKHPPPHCEVRAVASPGEVGLTEPRIPYLKG